MSATITGRNAWSPPYPRPAEQACEEHQAHGKRNNASGQRDSRRGKRLFHSDKIPPNHYVIARQIALYLFHFCGKDGVIKFCKFSLDVPLIGREFKNGLSSGITEMSAGFIIFLFNQAIIRLLNEDALVSYTIISYVNSLFLWPAPRLLLPCASASP